MRPSHVYSLLYIQKESNKTREETASVMKIFSPSNAYSYRDPTTAPSNAYPSKYPPLSSSIPRPRPASVLPSSLSTFHPLPHSSFLPRPESSSNRRQDRENKSVVSKLTKGQSTLMALDMRDKARPLHLLVGTVRQRTQAQEDLDNHEKSS